MTYRTSLIVNFVETATKHGYYTAIRKRRRKCQVCRHRHGASRNHAPKKCHCNCTHMLDRVWERPPWEFPGEWAFVLPIYAKKTG